WMIARGAQDEIDKSKKIITGAIIGLILTVGAYSITSFIVPAVLERTTGLGAGEAGVGNPIVKCCLYEEIGTIYNSDKTSVVDNKEYCDNLCLESPSDFMDCIFVEVPVSECSE
ncbi:MAG: hypothetical protein AAB932_04955, partial [Patescibacteria group bacterium]